MNHVVNDFMPRFGRGSFLDMAVAEEENLGELGMINASFLASLY